MISPPLHRFSCAPDPEDPYVHATGIIETRAEGLDDIVAAMETYLRAVGFNLKGSLLDIVPNDFGTPPKIGEDE